MDEINIRYFFSKEENNIQNNNKTNFLILNVQVKKLNCDYIRLLLKNDKVNLDYIPKIKINENNVYNELTDNNLKNFIINNKNKELNLVLILSPQNKITPNPNNTENKYLDLLNQLSQLKQKYLNTKTSDLALKKYNTFIYESSEQFENSINFDLSYLYSNPLIEDKFNKKNNYNKNEDEKEEEIEDNEFYNNIKNIFNLFREDKKKYYLEFNILFENDLKNYLKKSPKILHISTDANILNLNGKQQLYLTVEKNFKKSELTEDLIKIAIQNEQNSKKILLVIINTPKSIEIGKIFHDNGIENVVCVENKNNYPFSNEFSEKFICLFYKEIIEGNTIKISFNNAKKNLKTKKDLNNLIKLYGKGEKIIFLNKKIDNEISVKIDKSKSFKMLNNEKEYYYNTDINFNTINFNKNDEDDLNLINPKSSKDLLNIRRIDCLKLKRENSFNKFTIKSGEPIINHNCILNCNYEIEGNFRIIGQNKNIQKILINFTERKDKIVFVIGEKGMGKCLIIQNVGKKLFERRIFEKVIFIEIKNIFNDNNIIMKKINNNLNNNESYSKKKCLILINYKNIINEKEINDLEEKFEEILNKNENYYFLISLSLKENLEKLHYSKKYPFIIINKFTNQKEESLFNYLKNYDDNLNNKLMGYQNLKKNYEKIFKSSNGKINEIFLRINFLLLYFDYILKKISSLNFTTQEIKKKFFDDKETKNLNQKLFCLFFLLIEGVSSIELKNYLNENEIEKLNENYKFIIQKYYYKPIHSDFYIIDDSFLLEFKDSLDKNVIISLLKSILKYYYKVFYNIIINYNYLYDLINEKTNKIGAAFWLNFNILDEEENKIERDYVFMDYYQYNFENIIKNFKHYLKYIFEENNHNISKTPRNTSNIFETLNENDIYKNYFSQISIFLLTIIYKNKNDSKNYNLDLYEYLSEISRKFSINILHLNLLIFGFLTSQKTSNDIKSLDFYRNDIEGEISLIKIIQYFKTKSGENLDNLYESAKNIFSKQKNNYKLFKLNFLMGKINKNFEKCLNYYDYCLEYANTVHLKIKIYIAKGYYYLKHNDFNNATEFAEKAKKLYDEIDNNKKDFLLKEINELFNDINNESKKQNLLIFLEANQILTSNNNEILSIMNNAYHLKMKLEEKLKHNEINFKIFNLKEFDSFNNYFNYSGNFLYINSDEFDEDGNLYIEDQNGKSIKKNIDDLVKIIKDKNKTYELVILGFFNSEKLYSKLKFPSVIYFPYNKQLINLFKEKPNLMLVFKEYFYTFIIELLIQLSTETLFTSFDKAYNKFLSNIDNIPEIKNIEKYKKFIKLKSNKQDYIIFNEKKQDPIIINDFSSFSSINFNLNNYDEYKRFYIHNKTFGRKKEFYDIFQKILNNRYVNLYGETNAGKTQIALELCKFLTLRDFFKNGTYYIDIKNSSKKINKISLLKDLKDKNDETNIFIVLDGIDGIKNVDFLPISSNIHFLFISKEKINFLSDCEYYKLNSKLEFTKAKDFFIFSLYEKNIFNNFDKYVYDFFEYEDKEYKIIDIINYIKNIK